jgi:hypothetical protein
MLHQNSNNCSEETGRQILASWNRVDHGCGGSIGSKVAMNPRDKQRYLGSGIREISP